MRATVLVRSGLFAVILGLLVGPLLAEAQRPRQPPRVGVLYPGAPGQNPDLNALRRGLQDLGYIEGKSIVLETRWSEAQLDLQQALISELVRLPVDVLVVGTTGAALEATRLTTAIPIVAATAGALVEAGVVASLARPGGNVTGLTMMQADLTLKRLELLREALSKLSRVTALTSPYSRASLGEIFATQTETAARALGIQLQLRHVAAPSDLEDAFRATAGSGAGAVIFLPSPFFSLHGRRVGELALKHRLPTMGNEESIVKAGGLMAYTARCQYLLVREHTIRTEVP